MFLRNEEDFSHPTPESYVRTRLRGRWFVAGYLLKERYQWQRGPSKRERVVVFDSFNLYHY